MLSVSHLHSNNSVDEKQHNDEQCYIRKSLERFDKSPEKRSNALASAQQLHQSHNTKETEEVDGNNASRLCNAASIFRLINFWINDINETSKNDDEVENIPSVAKIVFEAKSGEFEYELESEDGRENHVKHIERICIELRLSIEFHGEGDCVDHNKDEDCVLERLRRHKPPHFILNAMLRYVSEKRKKTFPPSVFFKMSKKMIAKKISHLPAAKNHIHRKNKKN